MCTPEINILKVARLQFYLNRIIYWSNWAWPSSKTHFIYVQLSDILSPNLIAL